MENQPEDNQAMHRIREMADHEANVESRNLLTIFPNEVWMLIFEKIFQPSDLQNLQISSVFFNMLLGTQKTKILFSKVIQIFANSPINKLDAPKNITNHLLNCRLVCRTWRIGVDTALQSFTLRTSSKLLDGACHLDLSTQILPSDVRFSLQDEPLTFLQEFDGSFVTKTRNPFIGRGLYIEYRDQEQITDFNSFSQNMLQILAIYGHQIWSFGMYVLFIRRLTEPSTAWFFERLRDFLHLMPNLKVLKLKYYKGIVNDYNEDWQALKSSLESYVFPDLKDLTFLQSQNLPTPVFNALLRRYSHVKMLASCPWSRTSDTLMFTHKLPNLTQIAFSLRDLNKLVQLDTSNALWPLKTLIIRIKSFEVDWQSLFNFLENRWAATLTELKFDFPSLRFYGNHQTQVLPPLNLPNLKVFAFSSQVLIPLDLILPMRKSLERLVVRYYNAPGRAQLESVFQHEREIHFFRFLENLKSSNIWSLFPNLNTIEQHNWMSLVQLSRRPLAIM